MEDKKKKTKNSRDFPGGPVVKNLPSSAGDVDSILIGELRSHEPQGPQATTTEPMGCGAQISQKKNCFQTYDFFPLIFL